MEFAERLAKERRARLAAERLLDQKSRELFTANEKLALHARALSDQIVEQRQVVKSALTEAELLKGQNTQVRGDLDRAHSAAVMAERRLWDSINTIPDGFAVFDANTCLVAANTAYLAAFRGMNVGMGTTYREILLTAAQNGLIELGDETADDWCSRMQTRIQANEIDPVVVQFRGGNWVRLIDRRARDGDMVSLALNITEEMRIWAAIETIPDGFVLFDREERLLAFNHRYREMFPDSAEVMVPGTSFEDLLRHGLRNGHVPEAVGREEDWLAERLDQMRHANGVTECQLSDGRWIEEHDHRTPDGGRVGVRRDITQQREQQAALETARAEAAPNPPFWPICPTKFARR